MDLDVEFNKRTCFKEWTFKSSELYRVLLQMALDLMVTLSCKYCTCASRPDRLACDVQVWALTFLDIGYG